VIDDEELARKLLEQYISRTPELEMIAECPDPLAALPFLNSGEVDLIFLDIQMPELTGIEFLKSQSDLPPVIFTTAYPQYALEGYSLDVLDYLVKPIRFERFLQAAQKARARIIPPSTGSPAHSPAKDYLLVKASHKIHKLPLKDILYIKGMQEYVAFHTKEERIISLNSLRKLEDELPKNQFLRVHKSYIVSLAAIRTLEGNQLDLGTEKIPIGSSYRDELMQRVFS
jgi:DNA-binding LytR/AlgR family response regulator